MTIRERFSKGNRKVVPQRRRSNRSIQGTIGIALFVIILAVLFFFPVLIMINDAFKSVRELYVFPPNIFVRNPTLNNFRDLFEMISNTLVPFSKYVFNTVIIVVFGTGGIVILGAMCAFPLAKYKFPGSKFISKLIVFALMFSTSVTLVHNFITVSNLGILDSYLAVILPSFASTLGLYLMMNFMEQIPDSLLEAAKIDGAGDFKILWRIVMPVIKPAWVTAFILSFQTMWKEQGTSYIFSEDIKPLSYMLSQLASGGLTSNTRSGLGVSRAGVFSAVSLLMFIIPILVFLFSQRNVMSTMATSGMKD